MKHITKLLKLLLTPLQVLALLIASLFGLLQIPMVQNIAINQLIHPDYEMKLINFKGVFPFNGQIESMELSLKKTSIAKAYNINLDWSPIDLLIHKKLIINLLKINSITVTEHALPDPSKNDTFKFPKWSGLFCEVREILISKATYITQKKKYFNYQLKGKTDFNTDNTNIEFNLKNLSDFKSVIESNFSINQKTNFVNLVCNVKEKNGLLSYLFPSSFSESDLKIIGKGELHNFLLTAKGNIGSNTISANITTNLLEKKNIIAAKIIYTQKSATERLKIDGDILTNPALSRFELKNIHINNNDILGNISGTFSFYKHRLKTKDLKISTNLPDGYKLVASPTLTINTSTGDVIGDILMHINKGEMLMSKINTPLHFNALENLLNAGFKADIELPNLPDDYSQFSHIKMEGKVANNENTWVPQINFSAVDKWGHIKGIVNLNDAQTINISFDVLSCSGTLKGHVKDTLWNLEGNASIGERKLDLKKLVLSPKQTNSSFEMLAYVSTPSENIELTSKGAVNFKAGSIKFDTLRAYFKETFLEATGDMNLTNNFGSFNWHFYTFNVNDILGKDTAGTLTTTGLLNFENNETFLDFTGTFSKLTLPNLYADEGSLSGLLELHNNQNINLNVKFLNGNILGALVDTFSSSTSGTLNNFSTTATLNGFAEQELNGNLAFTVRDKTNFVLDTISLQIGKHRIFTPQPIKFIYANNTIVMPKSTVNISNGQIIFGSDFTGSEFSFNADLHNIPSDFFYKLTKGAYFVKGELNGNVSGSGESSNPKLQFNLSTQSPLYRTSLKGSCINGVAKADATINTKDLIMSANCIAPISISLSPFTLDFSTIKPFYIAAKTKGKLDLFQHIFDFNYDYIDGDADANITIQGTPDNPHASGYIKVMNGTYVRQNIGLSLKDINFELSPQNGKFILPSRIFFSDSNSNKGSINSAVIGLGKYFIPRLDADVSFDNIHIIDLPQTRRGGMSAFCTGNLSVTGPVHSLKVTAKGSISSLEKYAGDIDEVPTYKVNTIHKNPLSKIFADTIKSEVDTSATYDIHLLINKRFKIVGQGLDSSWNGNLSILGTANNPIYKGEFKLQNGELRILDRTFNIQRGEITFDGDLSPMLYLESNLQLPDVKVKIILEGDANNLQKRFTSNKNLSEQEIVQKVFFNTNTYGNQTLLSQSFQALNYLIVNSFIQSFLDVGFYQEKDPITHAQQQFMSIRRKLWKGGYVGINAAINGELGSSGAMSLSSIMLGTKPSKETDAEIRFLPETNQLGIDLKWEKDF